MKHQLKSSHYFSLEMKSAPIETSEEKSSRVEAEKTKSSMKAEYEQLVEAHEVCLEALHKLQTKQEGPEICSEEVGQLREELEARSDELQLLAASLRKSLLDEEESEEKTRRTKMVLVAEHLVCCAQFNNQAQLQPDLRPPLLVKVEQLTRELKTLKKKAGKSSRELDDLDKSLQGLSSDLAVLLSGPEINNPDILENVFRFLDPASVKAVSLVSR